MLIRYNHCKLINLTLFVPFTTNGIFNLTKCGLSPKGFCILRIVTRILVKTCDCSCNKNMYLWWCSNVMQIKIAEFYLEIFLLCLPWDISQQCAARGGEIWLHWTGMICTWAGNLTANFEKYQIPNPCPAFPLPPAPRPWAGFTLIGALSQVCETIYTLTELTCINTTWNWNVWWPICFYSPYARASVALCLRLKANPWGCTGV